MVVRCALWWYGVHYGGTVCTMVVRCALWWYGVHYGGTVCTKASTTNCAESLEITPYSTKLNGRASKVQK